jgi:hypothetical protein
MYLYDKGSDKSFTDTCLIVPGVCIMTLPPTPHSQQHQYVFNSYKYYNLFN